MKLKAIFKELDSKTVIINTNDFDSLSIEVNKLVEVELTVNHTRVFNAVPSTELVNQGEIIVPKSFAL
ncbi:MAG: hypothetical protein ACTSP4_14895, partial [Candidatus Hodarchaeales archaeon]